MSEDKECRQMESCPFCAGALTPYGSDLTHPVNDCWLSAVKIMPHEFEHWNRRAAKPAVPDALFDGYAVLQAMSEKARARTSPENVSDVLDAAVKLIRAATPPLPVAQGWISVQDRLPDTSRHVLLAIGQNVCIGFRSKCDEGLWVSEYGHHLKAPAYWMPRPVAPTPPAAPKEPTDD